MEIGMFIIIGIFCGRTEHPFQTPAAVIIVFGNRNIIGVISRSHDVGVVALVDKVVPAIVVIDIPPLAGKVAVGIDDNLFAAVDAQDFAGGVLRDDFIFCPCHVYYLELLVECTRKVIG